jgi:NTP pyrophosphatase (non-canonical NTP hydrolase)
VEKIDEAREDLDDVEKFIAEEKSKIGMELKEIQEELAKLHNSLVSYMHILDGEIRDAFENGDEKTWLSLTSRKSIMLQRLAELGHMMKKQ